MKDKKMRYHYNLFKSLFINSSIIFCFLNLGVCSRDIPKFYIIRKRPFDKNTISNSIQEDLLTAYKPSDLPPEKYRDPEIYLSANADISDYSKNKTLEYIIKRKKGQKAPKNKKSETLNSSKSRLDEKKFFKAKDDYIQPEKSRNISSLESSIPIDNVVDYQIEVGNNNETLEKKKSKLGLFLNVINLQVDSTKDTALKSKKTKSLSIVSKVAEVVNYPTETKKNLAINYEGNSNDSPLVSNTNNNSVHKSDDEKIDADKVIPIDEKLAENYKACNSPENKSEELEDGAVNVDNETSVSSHNNISSSSEEKPEELKGSVVSVDNGTLVSSHNKTSSMNLYTIEEEDEEEFSEELDFNEWGGGPLEGVEYCEIGDSPSDNEESEILSDDELSESSLEGEKIEVSKENTASTQENESDGTVENSHSFLSANNEESEMSFINSLSLSAKKVHTKPLTDREDQKKQALKNGTPLRVWNYLINQRNILSSQIAQSAKNKLKADTKLIKAYATTQRLINVLCTYKLLPEKYKDLSKRFGINPDSSSTEKYLMIKKGVNKMKKGKIFNNSN